MTLYYIKYHLKLIDIVPLFCQVNLNSIDAEDPEISDYQFLPDTPKLADRLKACLQEGDEIPRDFTKIFEHSLYKLDNALVPKVTLFL